ncbi:DNA2/NAM7 helicase AAA [Gracilaria domingensis]|nr:DNA2/NAM7 helicase AAA [Gracilaria domingensis]
MTQYKLIERSPIQELSGGPGIDFFHERTSHLSRAHEEYYKFWRSLLAEEEKQAGRFSKEIWALESHKREEEGRCLSNLLLQRAESSSFTSPHELVTPGTRICAVFTRHPAADIQPDLTKAGLGKGDFVVISAERVITDKSGFSRPQLSTHTWQCGLTNGFITHLSPNSVSVVVGRSLNAWVSHQGLVSSEVSWRIDTEEIYSSHSTSKRTVENLFCNKDDAIATRLRELIVDGKEPRFCSVEEVDRGIDKNSDFADLTKTLNEDQKVAVEMSMKAKDYLLILGMPGTGKTTTLATIVLEFASRGKTILLCSHTNTAVDNLLLKLLEHGFKDFIRLGRNLNVIDPRVHNNHISNICRPGIGTTQLEKDLDAPRVLATTCLGINHAVLARRTEFDLVVVDEASQILQPICIGPLQFACGAFILVGDHYQLPPLLRSAKETRGAARRSLGAKSKSIEKDISLSDVESSQRIVEHESLFRRLCVRHPEAMVSLSMQYRMAGDIMDLSNELVYGGSLRCGTEAIKFQALDVPEGNVRFMLPWLGAVRNCLQRVIFLDTETIEMDSMQPSETTHSSENPRARRRG